MKTGLLTVLTVFVALAAAAERIDWSKAECVQTGTRLVRLALTQPRLMKVAVMRIDLQTPGLRFSGTGRDADWGKPMPDFPKGTIRTRRERTSVFMQQERTAGRRAIVAFNSTPWSPWCSPYTHVYGDPAGLNISGGVVISDHKRKTNPLFVAWKGGRCEITESIPAARYGEVEVAHSGFDILMKEGVRQPCVTKRADLNPRIAYGLSANKRWLFVMTVDGRQPEWSLGASYADLCDILTDAGAVDALNVDGGGSTTLLYWDEKAQKPVMVNRHNAKGTYSRKNAVNIAISLP